MGIQRIKSWRGNLFNFNTSFVCNNAQKSVLADLISILVAPLIKLVPLRLIIVQIIVIVHINDKTHTRHRVHSDGYIMRVKTSLFLIFRVRSTPVYSGTKGPKWSSVIMNDLNQRFAFVWLFFSDSKMSMWIPFFVWVMILWWVVWI